VHIGNTYPSGQPIDADSQALPSVAEVVAAAKAVSYR